MTETRDPAADRVVESIKAKGRGPSMADVARLAGVSSQTVSRVSNGLSNVDERTRARVSDAMRELNYRPNGAARALKRGSFKSIGVIMFTLSTFGNLRTLDAISIAASDAGFSIDLVPVRSQTVAEVAVAFSRLSEHAVDGIIIIIESHILREADIRMPAGLPVVIVDSTMRSDHPVVDADQAQGARQATSHLLDLGHETVWHVAGPTVSYSAVRRESAWRTTLEEAGRQVPEVLYGDWTSHSGYQHGKTLAARDDVTAIFAANDQMALGILRALHETGRSVPADVSIVGFDDMEESASFWPPLTTIHQDFSEIGRRAIAALLRAIELGDYGTTAEIVPTHLVIRSSTAPARS